MYPENYSNVLFSSHSAISSDALNCGDDCAITSPCLAYYPSSPAYYHDAYRMEDDPSQNSSGRVSSFTQTLLDEDRLFYATFPDARPSKYEDNLDSIVSYHGNAHSELSSRTPTATASYSRTMGITLNNALQRAESWMRGEQTNAINVSHGDPVGQIDSSQSVNTSNDRITDHQAKPSSPVADVVTSPSLPSVGCLYPSISTPRSYPAPFFSESSPQHPDDARSSEIAFAVSPKGTWSRLHIEIPGSNRPMKRESGGNLLDEHAHPLTSIGLRQSPSLSRSLPVLLPSPHTERQHTGDSSSSSLPKQGVTVMRISPLPTKGMIQKKPPLACLFCRQRKIACGPPMPGSSDRTCNQCQRRSLKCVFPSESKRGARKKRNSRQGGPSAVMDPRRAKTDPEKTVKMTPPSPRSPGDTKIKMEIFDSPQSQS